MRLPSSNQVPRSISLQRSLQNGRQGSSGVHCTSFPQLGHLTVAGWPVEVFTAVMCLDNAAGEFELDVLDGLSGTVFSGGKFQEAGSEPVSATA